MGASGSLLTRVSSHRFTLGTKFYCGSVCGGGGHGSLGFGKSRSVIMDRVSSAHLRQLQRMQCGDLGRAHSLLGSRQRQMVGACVDEMGDAL